jgi:hypothetical protein
MCMSTPSIAARTLGSGPYKFSLASSLMSCASGMPISRARTSRGFTGVYVTEDRCGRRMSCGRGILSCSTCVLRSKNSATKKILRRCCAGDS